MLPQITPLTDLGRPAVVAYAIRNGQTEEEYVKQLGKPERTISTLTESAATLKAAATHTEPAVGP